MANPIGVNQNWEAVAEFQNREIFNLGLIRAQDIVVLSSCKGGSDAPSFQFMTLTFAYPNFGILVFINQSLCQLIPTSTFGKSYV